MNRPGKQPFSGACLAAEQHGGVGLRGERDALVHRAQLVAPSDDAVEGTAQREPGARRLRGAKRGERERARDLRGQRDEVALVLFVERRDVRRRAFVARRSVRRGRHAVEHLHDAAHRSPALFADRHREDGLRRVAGRLVDRGIEARVRRGVSDANGLAGTRHPAGDASLEREAKRRQLRQHRDAAHQIAVLGVDQPDGRALGGERLGHALAGAGEQQIEIDLARQQRGEIDEQRQAIDHRGLGRRRRRPRLRDRRQERASLERSVRHRVLHAKLALPQAARRPWIGRPRSRTIPSRAATLDA